MSANVSIAEMLVRLEAQVAHHRAQQAFHAEREVFHRDQKTFHEAALGSAVERFEAFQAAAAAAGEFVAGHEATTAPQEAAAGKAEPGFGAALSHFIGAVVDSRPPGEPFGASHVVKEIRERWGTKLRRRIDPRTVAATLRRWAAAGRLNVVREGRAYAESLYTKKAV